MYLPPLSCLSCQFCKLGLMAYNPGFSLWLDPVLHCLRDLCYQVQMPTELRRIGSVHSCANDSLSDLCQNCVSFKAKFSDLRMTEVRPFKNILISSYAKLLQNGQSGVCYSSEIDSLLNKARGQHDRSPLLNMRIMQLAYSE